MYQNETRDSFLKKVSPELSRTMTARQRWSVQEAGVYTPQLEQMQGGGA